MTDVSSESGSAGGETANCALCGLPMLENERMFMYHGYSETCEEAKRRCEADPATSKVEQLAKALSDLMDEQNGPPLFTREASWSAAMEQARKALKGTAYAFGE